MSRYFENFSIQTWIITTSSYGAISEIPSHKRLGNFPWNLTRKIHPHSAQKYPEITAHNLNPQNHMEKSKAFEVMSVIF
jgi:hypothetical protein